VSRSRAAVSQTSGSLTRAIYAASGGECDPKRFKIGTNAAETLRGTDDGDALDGRGGNDRLFGLAADDQLFVGSGANQADGGSGRDLVGFRIEQSGDFEPDFQPAARVDLAEGTYIVNGVMSRLTSIEGARGGEQADRFYGNGAGNLFIAYGGDDTLRGRGGNDHLEDGDGNDVVYGDGGADFIASHDSDADELHAGAGNDHLVPSMDDQAWGDGGADRFQILTSIAGQEEVEALFTIRDFSLSGGDLIDLSGLDTDGTGGQEGYEFIGGNALSANGTMEVRFEQRGGNTFVQYEIVDEGTPEGVDINEIELSGQKQLTANDFILDFTS
jgi:Ca2+-binding RTX toxin-like protein